MTEKTFDVTIENAVAHVRLCRPEKANSMTPAFWTDFPAAIDRISADGEARVIVLSGEGKHFSSGMDVSVFMAGALDRDPENPQASAEAFRHKILGLQRAFSALEDARQPVLAALQGGVIGGAVDMVAAVDCRYAAEDAYFCVQETAIGMTADVGAFPRLARIAPEGWVRQMVYTAESVPAAKAKEIGLVNEVYADAEATLAATMETAARIAAHAPLAVAGAKRMMNYARDHSTADALDYVALWNAAMLRPEYLREAYEAKAAGRAPNFDGLKPLRDGV